MLICDIKRGTHKRCSMLSFVFSTIIWWTFVTLVCPLGFIFEVYLSSWKISIPFTKIPKWKQFGKYNKRLLIKPGQQNKCQHHSILHMDHCPCIMQWVTSKIIFEEVYLENGKRYWSNWMDLNGVYNSLTSKLKQLSWVTCHHNCKLIWQDLYLLAPWSISVLCLNVYGINKVAVARSS